MQKQSKTITRTGESSQVVKGREGVVNGRYERSETKDNRERRPATTRAQNPWDGAAINREKLRCKTRARSAHPEKNKLREETDSRSNEAGSHECVRHVILCFDEASIA